MNNCENCPDIVECSLIKCTGQSKRCNLELGFKVGEENLDYCPISGRIIDDKLIMDKGGSGSSEQFGHTADVHLVNQNTGEVYPEGL
jgi:hypothetical protein